MSSFQRLLGFLRQPWRLVLLAVSLGWITTISWVALISSSAYLISYAALHPSVAELQVAIVGVRFFGISRAVFRYLERLVSHTVTFKVLAGMRVWLYERIEPLVPAGLEDQKSGDLYNKISGDIETLQDFYVRVVAPPLVAFLSSLMVLLFLGIISAKLAVLLFGFQVLAGVVTPLVVRELGAGSSRAIAKGREELANLIVDGVQGSADIQVFGQQTRLLLEFAEGQSRVDEAESRQNLILGGHTALVGLAINLAAFLILIVAIPMVNRGVMDGRLLAVVVLGALASFEAITPLSSAFQNLEESLKVGEGLFDLADRKPRVLDSGTLELEREKVDLKIKKLSFAYSQNGPEAVSNVELDLPQGKKVAILGPSGAGKSTILNLLLRLWPYEKGEISINGVDIREFRLDEVRKIFSYVPQNPFIFNTTLGENVRLGNPQASDEKVNLALEKASLRKFVHGLPDGLDTMAGEFGVMLSGGQRQRLVLARALVRDAPIYLLDEPTENLDPVNAGFVLGSFLDQLSRKSVLMITHQFWGLEKMDEILVMQGNMVVERGNHYSLLQLGKIYAWMVDQSRKTV